jgi:excisionase family DNA binding protein
MKQQRRQKAACVSGICTCAIACISPRLPPLALPQQPRKTYVDRACAEALMAPKMNWRTENQPVAQAQQQGRTGTHCATCRPAGLGHVSGWHVRSASAAKLVRTTDLVESDTVGTTRTHQPAHVEAIEHPVTFLTVTEAAALLRVSQVTLGRWRIEGRGPVYRKFGRRVLYADRDVIAWAADQARMSTSDQL